MKFTSSNLYSVRNLFDINAICYDIALTFAKEALRYVGSHHGIFYDIATARARKVASQELSLMADSVATMESY